MGNGVCLAAQAANRLRADDSYRSAAVGVTLAPRDFKPEVREPTAPPVDVQYAFDAAFTTLGHVIPMTLFRRPIERVLLRKARYEVEKNLSRLAVDWQQRVGAVIEELRTQAELAGKTKSTCCPE